MSGETLYKLLDRRDFLKNTLATVAILASGCTGNTFRSDKTKEESTRWAFLADTHIGEDVENDYGGFYPYKNLAQVIDHISSDLPDGVVICGDLARLDGRLGDYVSLKRLTTPLAEKRPTLMALGNHDNRDNFLKVFDKTPGEKQPVKNKHVLIVHTPPVRLIILDSLLYVNKVAGLLGKAQRQWLENYLNTSDETPTILCLHHTLGDGDGDLLDVPRLFDILKPSRKVKAIVYGHSHAYRLSEYEGVHLINIPATCCTFAEGEPVGWVEAKLTAKGGCFTLHAICANTDKDGSTTKLTWRP